MLVSSHIFFTADKFPWEALANQPSGDFSAATRAISSHLDTCGLCSVLLHSRQVSVAPHQLSCWHEQKGAAQQQLARASQQPRSNLVPDTEPTDPESVVISRLSAQSGDVVWESYSCVHGVCASQVFSFTK